MKRLTKQFALCLKNTGNEASLILGKVYRVVPDARAAKDDLVRVIDESGDDYLFHKTQFAFVEFPQAVRKKILAIQKAANHAIAPSHPGSVVTCRCGARLIAKRCAPGADTWVTMRDCKFPGRGDRVSPSGDHGSKYQVEVIGLGRQDRF